MQNDGIMAVIKQFLILDYEQFHLDMDFTPRTNTSDLQFVYLVISSRLGLICNYEKKSVCMFECGYMYVHI